ncbi:MAG: hypothetical protein IJ064_05995 [Bacteroidaceae bacterium]|nr:hypothetical protein [Bacteroidaceae bacterium]
MNTIAFNREGVSISVSVYVFKEDDVFIAYCPSLDLSGYDTTESKARQDFEYMLSEYLRSQMEQNTLHEDLTRHGWKVGPRWATEPKFDELLSANIQMQKVVAMPEFSKINVNTHCPAYV